MREYLLTGSGLGRCWKRRILPGLLALGGLLGPGLGMARYAGPEVEAFVAEMNREYGFAPEPLTALLGQASRQQSILDAISRPAERVRPWKEYRPLFLTPARISQGQAFWRQHEAVLARAEAEYGVPARFIVAIIGVETFYGRNTGNYRVIDALSTLGFDYPPRQPFFRQQLKEFLLLAREQQLDPLQPRGSYAGAMGLPQFMPGSFRSYAVDFDHDGHIDIWKNPADAIGSVANYFRQHGWQPGETVAVRARIRDGQAARGLSAGLEPDTTPARLQAAGWQPESAIAPDAAAVAFRLEGEAGDEYWIGLRNFYVITRYNHSLMYAMAVNQLAEKLADARGE